MIINLVSVSCQPWSAAVRRRFTVAFDLSMQDGSFAAELTLERAEPHGKQSAAKPAPSKQGPPNGSTAITTFAKKKLTRRFRLMIIQRAYLTVNFFYSSWLVL